MSARNYATKMPGQLNAFFGVFNPAPQPQEQLLVGGLTGSGGILNRNPEFRRTRPIPDF
jgi:hypothetical protein